MMIFLDTEFTDFPESECDLISIGLVADDGREFYAESTQYRQEACSQFVKDVVVPLLGQYPTRIVDNYYGIAKKLAEWLEPYRNEECIIAFDYNTDWHLMAKMLMLLPDEELPNFLEARNIWGGLDVMKLNYFWLEKDTIGWKPHMALYDAYGNQFAYREPLTPEQLEILKNNV